MQEQTTDDSRRVLVVADDRGAGELLTRLVVDGGWRADLAFSPNAALVELDRADPPFAVALLDLDGESDASTLRAVADIRRLPGDVGLTPLVVCASDDTIRAPAWTGGVDGFLLRPFRAEDLLSTLGEVTRRPTEARKTYRRRQLNLPRS